MSLKIQSPSRKLLPAAAAALLLALPASQSRAQADPPMQAGRLSYVSGSVSVQPVGIDDWGQADVNLPLGPGDRLFTDVDGRAEIEIGRTFIRLAPNTDLSVVDVNPSGISIGVAQGSVLVRTLGLWPGQSVHVNTPSGSATLNQPGQLRADVFPDQQAALFTNFGIDAEVTGAGGLDMDLPQRQSLELVGSNPVIPQWLEPGPLDDFDVWSGQRDSQISMAASWRYVSPEVPGAEELDSSGSWMPGTPYGAIWFPNVQPGWAPYHYGHWVNHAPWGPVWVEDESWGYAPFHYGRWVSFQGRWGWVPGPREGHPVWSPALVVFAGGIQVGGVAVSAWFPLGPGEPYRPWYPSSPRYVDQVNISNMTEGPRVHLLTTYVGFNFGGIAFSNRAIGVTAIRQIDFAAGRPVRQANVVVNVAVIQHITIIQRPVVEISQRTMVSRPPARPVPVAAARPVLINEKGMVVSARPGFRPVAAPVRPAPQARVLPGRKLVAPPPGVRMPPSAATAHPAPAPAATPPAKLAIRPQENGVPPPVGNEVRPAVHPAPKSTAQPPARPEVEPASKPAPRPAMEPAANSAPRPAVEPAEKPAPKTEAKPGEKPAGEHGNKSDEEKKNGNKDQKPNVN